MADNNWRWDKSSNNAFNLVADFFGMKPTNLANVKDQDAKKAIKAANDSDVQVKRTQDTVNAYKKFWRNQTKIGAMIHGLVRTGMQHVLTARRQQATTTKEYAKLVTNTSVLSAQTNTAVEKTYHRGAAQIKKAGSDLQLAKAEIDDQYQALGEAATQQSSQRRISYRERVQKRLAASERPWRN